MQDIIYKRVDSNEELDQILELQRINFHSSISEEESKVEGFVTVHHNLEILKAMNEKCAHIIAISGSKVVGYALCMLKEFKEEIEALRPMFQQIDVCLNKNKTYLVMGQICIDKVFRKRGVFRGMYHFMKQEMSSQYNMIITEVDVANTRSLNAHYAVGFKLLKSYYSAPHNWKLLCWKTK